MIELKNPYERIFRLSQRDDQFGHMALDISDRWINALFSDDLDEMYQIEKEIEQVEFLIKLDQNNG